MHLLFAINEPFVPEITGGGVLDIHHLALCLCARGHLVEVLATRAHNQPSIPARIRLRLGGDVNLETDTDNGYPTFRAGAPSVEAPLVERLQQHRPDVVVVQGVRIDRLIGLAISRRIPVIVRLVTAELVDDLAQSARSDPALRADLESPFVALHAESRFIAERVATRLELWADPLYPLIDRAKVLAGHSDPRYVTFVNPSAVKGRDLALEVVSLLPARDFLFVESWPLSDESRAELRDRARQLPNLRLEPPAEDVSEVYARTAVLIVPSQWQEAFGRVALEAAANGIPQLVSRVGGLPEAVGDGGVVLEAGDPPELWALELERILSDRELYVRLSARAWEHSCNPSFDPDQICRRFESSAEALIGTSAQAQ